MDCYDGMLKEIAKKVYSETNMETGETMRIMQEYDGDTFKIEEGGNLSAFGLAALVQNGFPTSALFSLSAQQELEKLRAEEDTWISSDETIEWANSKIASYNSVQKQFRCHECECIGYLSRIAEHWLGTHANLRVFQCPQPQCEYSSAWARCVRMHYDRQHRTPDSNQESLTTLLKEDPALEEVTKYLERLKDLVDGEAMEQVNNDSDEESCQNAIATQTSTPPPPSPQEHHTMSPERQEHESLHQQEIQDQEMHHHELHQQELDQQEFHQQELDQQEFHHQELDQQEFHQQELDQQEFHQPDIDQQEFHQQELDQQEFHQQELDQREFHQQELDQQEFHQTELDPEEYQQQELNQQELHQELHHQELDQQELQQQELHQQLHQQELQPNDLQSQELDLEEQELRQQQLEQEIHQQEIHQQSLQQEIDEQELQQQELESQEGHITHVIEEHIQVPEEVAKQLQQIAAAHGDMHPQLQIVITQQENRDLPPTIQIQIAQPQNLSPHLVSTSQQTIPLPQALSQTLASTITQQVIAAQAIVHQPVTQPQVIVQQPQVVQTLVPRKPAKPASRSRQTQSDSSTSNNPKRYNCTFCTYATDRRDLYTRHENIHRDEKPFHCYICQKQFNRADHVKKHFLRMHRDTPYDLQKIKRPISKESLSSSSTIQFFPKPQPRLTSTPQVEPAPVQNINIPELIQRIEEKKYQAPKKKPGEKRYTCPYCTWSGVDNWCLKRHLNTHLKPYTCTLCEYKAARSERLATHVFKVHNKKACLRCNFLADDQAQLTLHQQQNHTFASTKQPVIDYNCNYDSMNDYQDMIQRQSLKNTQKQLTCILCGMQTVALSKMAQHMAYHSASICSPPSSEDEDDNLQFRLPIQTIIDEKEEKLSSLYISTRRVLWEKYNQDLLAKKLLYCNICSLERCHVIPRRNRASLLRHKLFFHSSTLQRCSYCSKSFQYFYQLWLHKKQKHNI